MQPIMRNGAMTHTVAMGNLLSTDTSTLYLDANSGFDASRPITVFMVVTTRLGNAVTFKELGASAILSNFSVTNKLVGDASFALTAPTTNSNGAFTYSSSNTAVATVSGTTVAIVGAGTVTITATQAATDTYASNSIPATFIVLALANFSVPQKLVTDASFVLTAPQSNSDGAFTYSSSNPTVATVSGSTVTIVGAGTTIITATQAATATYASNSIAATFTVLILPTLSSFSVPSKNLGDAQFALTAPTTNSDGAFTYSSSNTAVATVSGSTVAIVGAGTATITATQTATATYASNSIAATFTVLILPTLSSFSVPSKNLGDAQFALTAPTTNSNGAFTYSSSNTDVATVSGSTVAIVGAGTATITATQAATATYASNSIAASLVVTIPSPISLNNGTITYTGNAADVPESSALFVQANPRGTGSEWFAVVKDGMKSSITTYSSGGTNAPFIPSGQTVPVPFNNIVTTLMTNTSDMFTNFNQPIGSWDTSNVTNMSLMFYNSTFNQPIGSWNTAKVTNMFAMFYVATAFNQPISSWNTAKVTNMAVMFANTNFNQPIGSWDTSNVVDMYSMFYVATAFNQPIGSWNTAKVTNMYIMFYNAYVFNQPIGSWNTANVTGMSNMFYYATAFNQPIGSWNTAKVIDMGYMFYYAAAFNQNLSGWKVGGLVNYNEFSTNSPLIPDNYPRFGE